MRFPLTLCFLLLMSAVSLAQVRPSGTPPTAPTTVVTPAAGTNPEASRPWNYGTRTRESADAPREKSPAARVIDTILNLALVLVIAYLVMLGVKRYMAGTLRLPGLPVRPQTRLLQVVETLPLAQGRSLYLVTAGARTFLIGASGQQLTLLGDITGDGAVDAARTALQDAAPPTFDAALARVLPAGPDAGRSPARHADRR